MEQRVLGSVPGEQTVLKSKMFFGAKYESAKCAKEQSFLGIKVCVSLLCPQELEFKMTDLSDFLITKYVQRLSWHFLAY